MDAVEQKCYVISMQTTRGFKYYVGKTQNVLTRANEHATGMGSAWTKKFHSVGAIFDIIEVVPCIDKFTEDNTTKEYMSKYGIENVRGGSYANIILADDQIMALNRELATSNDSCFNCGKQGHFSGDCIIAKMPQKTTKNTGVVRSPNRVTFEEPEMTLHVRSRHNRVTFEDPDSSPPQVRSRPKTAASITDVVCYRCGRPGHTSPDCFAQKHSNGTYIGKK